MASYLSFTLFRVLTKGPKERGSIPGRVKPKTYKMVLDAYLLDTRYYKVWIKSKVEQPKERLSALPNIYVK